jgi:endonuclease III
MIARLDVKIEQMITPISAERDLLVTIPGIGPKIVPVNWHRDHG